MINIVEKILRKIINLLILLSDVKITTVIRKRFTCRPINNKNSFMKKSVLLFGMILMGIVSHANDSTQSIIQIPFVQTGNCNLVVIKCQLNGMEAYMMVDCGSEITILNRSMEHVFGFREGVTDNKSNTDWSGTSVDIFYAKKIDLTFGNVEVTDNIRIADIDNLLSSIGKRTKKNVIGIIGTDVLKSNHLVIDYNTMSIHN